MKSRRLLFLVIACGMSAAVFRDAFAQVSAGIQQAPGSAEVQQSKQVQRSPRARVSRSYHSANIQIPYPVPSGRDTRTQNSQRFQNFVPPPTPPPNYIRPQPRTSAQEQGRSRFRPSPHAPAPERSQTSTDTKAPSATMHMEMRYGDSDPLLNFQRFHASRGSAASQYAMGMRYLKGIGVPQDEAEGLHYLKRAAAQGHLAAREFLHKKEVRHRIQEKIRLGMIDGPVSPDEATQR